MSTYKQVKKNKKIEKIDILKFREDIRGQDDGDIIAQADLISFVKINEIIDYLNEK